MIEALLGVVIALLVVLILLITRRKEVGPSDVEAAVSGSWIRLGLADRISAVEEQARQIRDSYRSFEQLLRVPTERGSFGELALETILSDQLPPDMFTIRKRVFDGKVPDGTIRSTVGMICIDAKFPLENYRQIVEATRPSEEQSGERAFERDVRAHLDKIAVDYVKPEKGSAEFAFAYIPSESVYYHLLSRHPDMLREYAKRGVQVVSPLTLTTKVEMIKAGVYSQHLSENARRLRDDIRSLARVFSDLDESWHVFYATHLRNAVARAEDVDHRYAALKREFGRVSQVEGSPDKT